MQSKPASGDSRPQKKYYSPKKKFCYFCKERIALVDYKQYNTLQNYVSETGKIFAARISGACSYHQKQLGRAIKRARHMALLKFVENK